MREAVYPQRTLTVVISNVAPLVHLGEPVQQRTVQIELTDEQIEAIKLNWVGTDRGNELHEHVSCCFFDDARKAAQ